MTSNENTETEYDFCGYGLDKEYVVKITVSGGGMMNGNAYATVECIYKSEEDYENDPQDVPLGIYYCEYGKNPIREYRGNTIEFADDGDRFNIKNYNMKK